ncbi:hypothetical protein GE061_002378 [Apolygus lucorum]|uniref:Uncharacterized protein n=1 Tax=Apolygus lucorum TaxID=248454 RepID=A0A6A4JJC5_APOLU|nr:hypothetical protein GE061_002378 [Apolygus lucorum]
MGLLDSYGRQDSKRQLSIDQKLEAIRRVTDLGETKASVSRMYGVPESTLRGWCKNKDKLVFLSMNKQRDSKRKSDKHIGHYDGLLMPVQTQDSPESKKVKLEVEMTKFQEPQNCEVTPPLAHSNSNTQPPQTSPIAYDLPRLFALYCGQAGTQGLDMNPEEPLSLVKRNHDSPPSSPASDGSNSSYQTVPDDDTIEAIQHGEQFLRWLEGVSDPSITRLQLLQFRCLLEKVKTASFSRKLKSENPHLI